MNVRPTSGSADIVDVRSRRASEPAPRRWGGLTFLVIEDDPLQAIDLEYVLEDMGHGVAAIAPNLPAARAELARHGRRFECVLLDLDLSGQSSVDIALDLQARGVPHIVVTGHARQIASDFGLTCPVVEKPYTVADLRAALSRAFA